MASTLPTKAYGATGSFFGSTLSKMDIEREEPKADEVLIDILYCGVCHSDLHQVKNDWHNTVYPWCPICKAPAGPQLPVRHRALAALHKDSHQRHRG